MTEAKTHILLFFLPLIIGNIMHMVVVKNNLFQQLNIPLSINLFGKNKTYRGFVVLPIFCISIILISSFFFGPITRSIINDVFIGFGLGVVYMLSELPNSYIKRRLGIANGEQSQQYKYLQALIDKADSLIGILIFYYFVVSVPFKSIVIIFFIALSLHFCISYLLVCFNIKKSL